MSSAIYMNSNTELTPEKLAEIVEKHYSDNVPRYLKLYDLYKGNHDILKRPQKDALKPNNRLVNNFYGQIVDDVIGYFLGKPIVISVPTDDLQYEFDYISDENEIDDLFMEIGKECSIKGKSSLMVYQDEEGETQLVRISPEQVIFVYDSSKHNKLLYAIRVYEQTEAGEDEPIKHVEVYSDYDVTYYKESKGVYYLDSNIAVNPMPHIFEQVPFVEFLNNEEEMGDFERVISLVNDYDKIFSDQSNEHESYRHAYLVLKNMTIDANSMENLKENGIIEVMENGDAKFLTKDIQTNAVENHLNRLEENIYRFTQVPNLSDEKFASNLSGIAIRFKLFGMENKCITKERKFTKGVRKLLKLLAVPLAVKTGEKLDIQASQIQFTRNIPDNIAEAVDAVQKLNGIVDKETLLSILPFIDNPTLILEKLEAETDIYAKEMQALQSNGEEAETSEGSLVDNAEEFNL